MIFYSFFQKLPTPYNPGGTGGQGGELNPSKTSHQGWWLVLGVSINVFGYSYIYCYLLYQYHIIIWWVNKYIFFVLWSLKVRLVMTCKNLLLWSFSRFLDRNYYLFLKSVAGQFNFMSKIRCRSLQLYEFLFKICEKISAKIYLIQSFVSSYRVDFRVWI